MSEHQRLHYIDKLKGLAMLLVVMGHTIYFCTYHEQYPFHDDIFSVICTFHVPLFFFLSGVVIKTPPDIRKFGKKAYRFMAPMLIVGFINAVVIDKIGDFFLNGGHNGYWYLLTLTIFYMMLIPFRLNKQNRKKWMALLTDTAIAIAIWCLLRMMVKADFTTLNALNLYGAFLYWPYFVIGHLFRKYNLIHMLTGYWNITLLTFSAYLILVICLYSEIDNLPIFLEYFLALLATAALTGLFSRFENSNTWIERQLLLIGNHTLDIYIYHYFFIRFIDITFIKNQNIMLELAFIAILTLIIVYASIGIGKVVNEITNYTMNMKKLLLILSVLMPMAAMADAYDANNYQPENKTVKLDETNLPIVFIDTQEQVIHKDYRVAVRMKIINNANGINYADLEAHPDQTIDYEGWIGIKYRGNSSFDLSPKKPYGFKTLKTSDVDGKKDKVDILGMPADNDWVLLAPYNDRSMIRDVLMYQLARPYFEYTPRLRHCEVIVDGMYYGVYIIGERPRKGKNRLNLDDPGDSGDELTGGYQVQIDRQDEDHWYVSKYPAVDKNGNPYYFWKEISFQYKHPEYDEMMPDHPQQLEYIQRQIDAMEDALASDDFKDPETGYRKYMDAISFIDQQLSQEVSNNVDGYRLSTNIYKHRDSQDPHFKTTLWDFNVAFGNADYCGANLTDCWMYQNTYLDNFNAAQKVPFWWMRLMEDPDYVAQLKARWKQYREGFYSDKHIEHTIDSLVNHLDIKEARKRNYKAWPLWNKYVWPVPNWQTVNTWEKEIAYLKSWLKERIAWMDEQLDYTPEAGVKTIRHDGSHKAIKGYYNLQGIRLSNPQKGIVVVQYNDGSSRKIIVKHE
ncbi:MAG: CotH kinase family protein [Prevotella sp.]|nr:CotH kinase family protein [Prevotella sp.]